MKQVVHFDPGMHFALLDSPFVQDFQRHFHRLLVVTPLLPHLQMAMHFGKDLVVAVPVEVVEMVVAVQELPVELVRISK